MVATLMKVLPPVFFRKYSAAILVVLILVFLPEIVVPAVFNLYKEKFYEDVVIALDKVIKDEPYCIIAPRLVEQKFENTSYSFRRWVVLRDPLKIDLSHVLDHAIRQKLIFYAKEGHSLRRRLRLGNEMHFGVAKKDAFYIWSFKKSSFVELKIPVLEVNYLRELKSSYITYSRYQHLTKLSGNQHLIKLPEYIDPTDYYCSLSHQQTNSGEEGNGNIGNRDQPT